MTVFKEKSLDDQTLFQKLFKRLPKDNAIKELNNLLAQNEDRINSIPKESVQAIGDKYKVNFKKSSKNKLLEMYEKYLNYCLEDRKLDKLKINTLYHLKNILFLDDHDTQDLIKLRTHDLFNKEVKKTFDSGQMDESKWDYLEKLKTDILISKEESIDIYRTNAMNIINNFMKDAISDKRYSPEEEQKLFELAKNYGADLKIESDTQTILSRYRQYWEIENGKLPTIESKINLPKSETLHFTTSAAWQEQRKVTKRYNYAGPTARIKIVKGVYYRFGSMDVRPQSEDVWQTIDNGSVYLTNKRLIFMGEKGNKTIPINKILDFTPYSNGVDIQKDSGKSPFLEFSNETELFAMILSRLKNE
jgi:hypothetical protein